MKPSQSRILVAGACLVVFAAAAMAVTKPKGRQALSIIWEKSTGSLADVRWSDLFRMARSGKHFGLPELSSTKNPYAAIQNPYNSSSDVASGSTLFQERCAMCHGPGGEGGPGGPKLRMRQMVHGGSDWAIFRTISLGVPGTGMPANNLPWLDRWRLVAYITSLASGTSPGDFGRRPPIALSPVTYDAITNASAHPADWITYSGSYDSQRFSAADQITTSNVSHLRLLWAHQYDTPQPSIETSPIVVGGYMFVTLPPDRVEALDAKTGKLLWYFDREVPTDLRLCCGIHNRGVAVLGDMVYFGTLDAHLIALDLHTGRLLWDIAVADYKSGYSLTGAPLIVKGMVITGVGCGEFGARGFIEARDAKTGSQVWRFETLPQPGQPGSETWANNSLLTGGGPAWLTGSFDPRTNTLYWPVGNPSPDYDGASRLGDNLYTDSVVALDVDHGTMLWYFQFTPHDVFDWDAAQILVLFDGTIEGKSKRLLAQANRNGFFYLLDAQTGAFLRATSFAKQTWASGVDSHGRPILVPGAQPTETGTTTFPGVGGAINWESPSYSPKTGLLYVPTLDSGGVFTSGHSSYRRGDPFVGGSFEFFSDAAAETAVRALNPVTGEVAWEYRNSATSYGGLLSTGGSLVFGSQSDRFFALDAKTGRELWQVGTGGRITAAPVTFLVSGQQYVTIAAGHDILTFGL